MTHRFWWFSRIAQCVALAGLLAAAPVSAQSASAAVRVSATIVDSPDVAPTIEAALRLANASSARVLRAGDVVVEQGGARVRVRTETPSVQRPLARRTVTISYVGT